MKLHHHYISCSIILQGIFGKIVKIPILTTHFKSAEKEIVMKHQVSIEEVTPKKAQEWLIGNHGNRHIRKNQVDFLSSEMKAGRFMPTTAIHFTVGQGEARLINGQHTLCAVISSGVVLPAMPVIRTSNYSSEEEEMLYIHYDIGVKRTFSDSATAMDYVNEYHTNKTTLNQIAAALRFMANGFHRQLRIPYQTNRGLPISFLMEHVPKWLPQTNLIHNAIQSCSTEMRNCITKAPIFSVALLTAYYQPTMAQEFWHQVAMDDRLPIGDPRKTLHDFLPKTIQKGRSSTMPVGEHIQARSVAVAWNAYAEERLLSRIAIFEKVAEAPLKLLKTDFSGNQGWSFMPYRDDKSPSQAATRQMR